MGVLGFWGANTPTSGMYPYRGPYMQGEETHYNTVLYDMILLGLRIQPIQAVFDTKHGILYVPKQVKHTKWGANTPKSGMFQYYV